MQHVSRRVFLASATGTMAAAGGLFANENASARLSTFRRLSGKEFLGMEGTFAPMYTPFNEDESLNEGMIDLFVEYALKNGLRGFYVTGSTGEGLLMRVEERKQVFRRVAKANRGRGKLIAHVGCVATRDAVELAKCAADCGFDWISSITPVFYGQSDDGLFTHYRRIASATDLPFMAYACGAKVVPDRDIRLFDIPNVKGMKYTGHDYWDVQRLANRFDKEAIFFVGADEQLLNALSLGGLFSGAIGTSYNSLPRHGRDIVRLAGEGRYVEAQRLQDELIRYVEVMHANGNASWSKAIMRYIGLDHGPRRGPGRPLTAAEYADLERRLDALGFVRKNDAMF